MAPLWYESTQISIENYFQGDLTNVRNTTKSTAYPVIKIYNRGCLSGAIQKDAQLSKYDVLPASKSRQYVPYPVLTHINGYYQFNPGILIRVNKI